MSAPGVDSTWVVVPWVQWTGNGGQAAVEAVGKSRVLKVIADFDLGRVLALTGGALCPVALGSTLEKR